MAKAKEVSTKKKVNLKELKEQKPVQQNFNYLQFEMGDKKDFIFNGIKDDVSGDDGEFYEAALLEDENEVVSINADVVLMTTLKTMIANAEIEEGDAIRVICNGMKEPRSAGKKPYKDLTILKF